MKERGGGEKEREHERVRERTEITANSSGHLKENMFDCTLWVVFNTGLDNDYGSIALREGFQIYIIYI